MKKTLLIIPWPQEPLSGLPEGVDCKALNDGTPLNSYVDIVRNEHLFFDAVVQAEKDGYGAVMSLCFADSGIEVARKLVDIPVLGCMRVALHIAGMLGHKACLLQPDYELNAFTTQHLIDTYNMGHFAKIVNTHVESMPISLDIQNYQATGNVGKSLQACIDAAVKSFEEDATDVVVLSSGALVGAEGVITSELKKRGYDVPVVNGLTAAAGVAQVLNGLNLSQSRLGYPKAE